MGAPQIIVIIWSVIAWMLGLCRIAKVSNMLNYSSGAAIMGAIFSTVMAILFQLLLALGGFYG